MKGRTALELAIAGVLVVVAAQADTVTHAVRIEAIASVSGPATATQPAVRVKPPGPTLGGCPMYPGDNAWNTRIRDAPLLPNSAQMIGYIQAHGGDNLHPDFGENPAYGIPYVVVPQNQQLVPITYDAYGDESEPGPFPIPLDAPIEGAPGATNGDRHVLVLQQGTCRLFELGVARRSGGGWLAAGGARFDMTSNALRPLGWTSADAAGLPILPGLVRYDEVAAGHIDHAIRITFDTTRRGFILPATHFASSVTDVDAPAMGQRLRLKAGYDISGLTGQARVIAEAMKNYGVIVADNGSNWFFQGAPSAGWVDDDLGQLKGIPGTAFEAVDTGPVRTG
ncbi:MAG: hypothetical protein WCC60_14800 [Ilumatobacteraceae bacterium]